MKYVTVFKEVIDVKNYSSTEIVRIFKSPLYPFNEFKLTLSSSKVNGIIDLNLYVSGPTVPKLYVKISKRVDDPGNPRFGRESSSIFDLSDKIYFQTKVRCKNRVEDPGKKFAYMYVADIKIEFSVPENRVLSPEETARRLVLFNNPTFSDFKICVVGKTFHVSKSIIARSSEMFRSLFAELDKKQEDTFLIDGFKVKVIEMMLKSAYDENIKLGNDIEFVKQLFVAAKKYGMEKLKARCEDVFINHINDSTVFQYYEFAIQNNSERLQWSIAWYLRRFNEEDEEVTDFLRRYPELLAKIVSYREREKMIWVLLFSVVFIFFVAFLYRELKAINDYGFSRN